MSKLSGKVEFFDNHLQKCLTSNRDLVNWRKQVTTGHLDLARKDGDLVPFEKTEQRFPGGNSRKPGHAN